MEAWIAIPCAREPLLRAAGGDPIEGETGGSGSRKTVAVARILQNTKGVDTSEQGCNHAEQRMIRAAEDKGLLINQISATNNCCDACHKALVEHNDAIKISDPNGNQVQP